MGGLMLGTLDQPEKNNSKNGSEVTAINLMPALIAEGIVIMATASGAIYYLLKAFGA